MKTLFIHGSFPAQFVHLAPFIASTTNERTVFITFSDADYELHLPGVDVIRISRHRLPETDHPYLERIEESTLSAQAVITALRKLKVEQGYVPDVIISHGGLGYSFYLRHYLPKARLISYMEWYFKPETSKFLTRENRLHERALLESTNMPILQELEIADIVITPTEWQKSQFPSRYQDKIEVIFDGVAVSSCSDILTRYDFQIKSEVSNELITISPEERIISYATRGMEPLRGFPEFMRGVIEVMQEDKHLKVVIGGRDRVVYSYPSDHPSGSWKQLLLDEAKDAVDLDRFIFTGLLKPNDYLRLLARSDLHCFFSHPYIVSWGLFQAVSLGCKLLINNSPGFSEAFDDYSSVCKVELSKPETISKGITEALDWYQNNPPKYSLPKRLELKECLDHWRRLLSSM